MQVKDWCTTAEATAINQLSQAPTGPNSLSCCRIRLKLGVPSSGVGRTAYGVGRGDLPDSQLPSSQAKPGAHPHGAHATHPSGCQIAFYSPGEPAAGGPMRSEPRLRRSKPVRAPAGSGLFPAFHWASCLFVLVCSSLGSSATTFHVLLVMAFHWPSPWLITQFHLRAS